MRYKVTYKSYGQTKTKEISRVELENETIAMLDSCGWDKAENEYSDFYGLSEDSQIREMESHVLISNLFEFIEKIEEETNEK